MDPAADDHGLSAGCTKLLEKLSQQVNGISERLSDLEEHVSDLSTDVRLQARKSTLALPLPPLSTAGSHDGSVHSLGHSGAVSPRVAGPVAVQIARSRSKHASLVGSSSGALLPQGSAHAPLPAEPATSAVSTGTVSHPAPSAAASTLAVPEASGDGGSAWRLGVFGQVKVWGEGSAADSPDLKQVLQLAQAAAAAAAEAQAAADTCQQQMMELKGRQGQAERRLDTLWQLQETASSNQAAIVQIQAQIEQQQQAVQQQQQNMAALRAQVSDSNKASAASVSTCAQLHIGLQQLQQRLEQCCKDVSRQADQMAEVKEQQQATTGKLKADLQAAQQQVQQQLGAKQTQLDSCAAAAQAALGKCEDLRQGAVVLTGRSDATTGHIKAAVEPLSVKLADLEAKAAAWSKSATLAKSAVQQQELAAGIAQLSTAATRRDHERAQQMAGLASRLEVLEEQTTATDQVVTQDHLQHKLAEVRASLAASLTSATRELQAQLRTKADEAATLKVTSSLAERVNSSETSLLIGLRSLRDKTAVLIDGKADAAGLKRWQQDVLDSLAGLKVQVSKAATGAEQQQQRLQTPSPAHGQQTLPQALRGGRHNLPSHHFLQAEKRSPGKQSNTVSGVVENWEYGLPAAAAAPAAGGVTTTAALAAALAGAVGAVCDNSQGPANALTVRQCVAAAEAALARGSVPKPRQQQPAAMVLSLPVEEPQPATADSVSDGVPQKTEGMQQAPGPEPLCDAGVSDADDVQQRDERGSTQQAAAGTALASATAAATAEEVVGPTSYASSSPAAPIVPEPAAAAAEADACVEEKGTASSAEACAEPKAESAGSSSSPPAAAAAVAAAAALQSLEAAPPSPRSLSLLVSAVQAGTGVARGPQSPRLVVEALAPLSPGHTASSAGAQNSGATAATPISPGAVVTAPAVPAEPPAGAAPAAAAAAVAKSPGASSANASAAAPLSIKKYASTKGSNTGADKPVRKSVRSQSQIGASTRAGALHASQPHSPSAAAAPAAAGRPFSALQPWSVPKRPPSTSASELHSAATNAKLVLAGQQKEAARQQLAQRKLPHTGLALGSCRQLLNRNSSGGVSSSSSGAGSGAVSGCGAGPAGQDGNGGSARQSGGGASVNGNADAYEVPRAGDH